MKAKFFLSVASVLLLCLVISACGRHTECADADGNGFCDSCKQRIDGTQSGELILIEDGEALFQVVFADSAPFESFSTANLAIKAFLRNEYDITVDVVTEKNAGNKIMPTEILIGKVASRGIDYSNKGYTIGPDDYIIKVIGTKVLIDAGSPEKLELAIQEFADSVLKNGTWKKTAIADDYSVLSFEDERVITSIKLNGEDMKDYVIAADFSSEYYASAAELLQSIIYRKTGYWFKTSDIADAGENAIIIRHASGASDEESFKISTEGSRLLIECAYDNAIEIGINSFVKSVIETADNELNFEGEVYVRDISVLYYEDFGAVGDGKTDDFKAMYDTHVCANEGGQTVKGTAGATYYIKDTQISQAGGVFVATIPIRTNTDWQGAKIIIDDSEIASYAGGPNYSLSGKYIFSIIPDEEHALLKFTNVKALDAIVSAGLNPNTKRIDLKVEGWNGPLMIIPYNSEHKVFRRKGTNYNPGDKMQEVIVIDKDGMVSDETPIMFEYTHLDSIDVYKLDPTDGVTVKNAIIETLESKIPHPTGASGGYFGSYKKRGIEVTRSYSTLENIEHIITGGFNLVERANGLIGANALGMFKAAYATNVTFKNCIIPGRLAYGNGSSYNFGANYVNKMVLDGCIQSNFWVQANLETGEIISSSEYSDGACSSLSSVRINGKKIRMFWGVGGTNFCKNMEFINSKLSRFDAHKGLYNGKIIGSEFNSSSITGKGDMIIEDSKWYQYEPDIPLLYLRRDYGYYWDGDISVKDTEAHLYDTTSVNPVLYVINHEYQNWYFGYPMAIPNLTLDNLDVYSIKKQAPMASGYEIYLLNLNSFEPTMHLEDSGKNVVLAYEDTDGDGFIDEPTFDVNRDGKVDKSDLIDLDGDGKVGNTSLSYTDRSGWIPSQRGAGYNAKLGVSHPSCAKNVNVTKPPSYIKIINNDGVKGMGGYTYIVPDTSGMGISDGGWNRDASAPDTMGGFFGNTKFIYGDGAEDFFHGTNYVSQNTTKTFKFVKID